MLRLCSKGSRSSDPLTPMSLAEREGKSRGAPKRGTLNYPPLRVNTSTDGFRSDFQAWPVRRCPYGSGLALARTGTTLVFPVPAGKIACALWPQRSSQEVFSNVEGGVSESTGSLDPRSQGRRSFLKRAAAGLAAAAAYGVLIKRPWGGAARDRRSIPDSLPGKGSIFQPRNDGRSVR